MAHRILILILLSIPFALKFEILPGVRFLIQEPFLLFFTIACNLKIRKVNSRAFPFLLLIFSLTCILLSSVITLFKEFYVVGAIKTIKYLLYASAILTVLNNPKYIDKKLLKYILNIGFVAVLLTLCHYFYTFLNFGKSWKYYVSYSTWHHEYMPTGLSNLAFDFQNFAFHRVGGNHGIYGSYLVLLLILSIRNSLKTRFKKSKLLILLILMNLSFITSREAILLLVLTLLFYGLNYFITKSRINKKILIFSGTIIGMFIIVLIWNPNVVIVHKINHMLNSLNETGGFDSGVNLRFNTWYLYYRHLLYNPTDIIFGVGYNVKYFYEILTVQEYLLMESLPHVDKAESFYVTTLAYGGIFSFISGLLFFVSFIYLLYKKNDESRIISFFVMALMVTNGTGSSVLGELLLSQLGLVSAIMLNFSKKDNG